MRRVMRWLILLGVVACASAVSVVQAQDDVYYARCNLKLDGKEITWVNWQAAPEFVPVGTKLQVTERNKNKATLVNLETKATYSLDFGAPGDAYLEKFVSKVPVSVTRFPQGIQDNIRKTFVAVELTVTPAV